MSLVGKLEGTRMGDRSKRTKPAKAEERKVKCVHYHEEFIYLFFLEDKLLIMLLFCYKLGVKSETKRSTILQECEARPFYPKASTKWSA